MTRAFSSEVDNLDAFPEIGPGGSAAKIYCIDHALRRAFHRKPGYELYTVTHEIPSSGWHGYVGRYRLVVDKGASANLVAFCPPTATMISPTTFEWTATNDTSGGETRVPFFVGFDAASSSEWK